MTPATTIFESTVEGLSILHRGKVRDVYDLGDKLVIMSSDRISAYDYVLPNPIPDKGKILNQTSLFWFDQTKKVVKNHLAPSTRNSLNSGELGQGAESIVLPSLPTIRRTCG